MEIHEITAAQKGEIRWEQWLAAAGRKERESVLGHPAQVLSWDVNWQRQLPAPASGYIQGLNPML